MGGLPYALVKVLKGEEPFLKHENRLPKEQAEFLMDDNHMEGKYLGECLDSCRWGSITTVMWEMTVREMIDFVKNWMRQNHDNFQNLWHERKIEELYTKFELPYVHSDKCIVGSEHSRTVYDNGGRLRCAYAVWSVERAKPLKSVIESDEEEEDVDDAEDEDDAEEVVEVHNACYSVISEKGLVLPLETVIKRLMLNPKIERDVCNDWVYSGCKRIDELPEEDREYRCETLVCPGHDRPTNKLEFPFDGWDLAFYVQKWWEQAQDKAPWYECSKQSPS